MQADYSAAVKELASVLSVQPAKGKLQKHSAFILYYWEVLNHQDNKKKTYVLKLGAWLLWTYVQHISIIEMYSVASLC